MYSAVLMLALTAGTDAVDFGNRCAKGCTTVAACSTSCTKVAGCTTSCTTRVVHRLHGCTTTVACTKVAGCAKSCHSGLFARLHNRCTTSCVKACTKAAPAAPVAPKVMPPETGPKKVMSYVPATIVVSLPADARLSVDGSITNSTTERRVFLTPGLEVGTTYVYTMRAEIVRNGITVNETHQVAVTGGDTANVLFQFATQGVASR